MKNNTKGGEKEKRHELEQCELNKKRKARAHQKCTKVVKLRIVHYLANNMPSASRGYLKSQTPCPGSKERKEIV